MKALLSTGLFFLSFLSRLRCWIFVSYAQRQDLFQYQRCPLSGGRVIILFDGGGASAKVEDLPADFLSSWNINTTKAKADAYKVAQADLDRRINAGRFREVDGIVYNTLAPDCGWVTVQNAKLIQALDVGSLIDPNPMYPIAIP